MGQIIYREYIVFRGSNISCSLATENVEERLAVLLVFLKLVKRLLCSEVIFLFPKG